MAIVGVHVRLCNKTSRGSIGRDVEKGSYYNADIDIFRWVTFKYVNVSTP